jgi:hypothetical protein
MQVAVVAVVAAAVLAVVVVQNRPAAQRSLPTSSPSTAPTTITATGTPYVDQEYLLAVPAQDMRAEINRCAGGCIANTLIGTALARAVGPFPDLQPLAGGFVTQHGALVLQTIEAEAGPFALAHLTVRRSSGSVTVPRTAVPTVRTTTGPGYRTTTVSTVRAGCRFTAVLVARAAAPPVAHARTWATTNPLRCA